MTADGSLMREPRRLATTGYDDLDVLAIEQAAQQNLPMRPMRPCLTLRCTGYR
ncbi:MAG: hypothetical protein HC929_15320 [Leptolyngbyaceae cyanobacterium SM2_5_2]|nr:hypothetical protein [Leptolyngbyaceae cyanobacterium SM2_5_2]